MSGQPNTRLADLFGLAGWSKGELARLVNRQAAAMGHPQLSTDTSRVRRWIDTGEIRAIRCRGCWRRCSPSVSAVS